MAKPHITRTLAQIHFEDLDPHRFEDLVRQLIYDFKQWQSIESTGRGGADDGFDVRAYEIAAPSAGKWTDYTVHLPDLAKPEYDRLLRAWKYIYAHGCKSAKSSF